MEEKLEHIRALGRQRAKKFYEKNKEAIVKKKQEERKLWSEEVKKIKRPIIFVEHAEEEEEEIIVPPSKKLKMGKEFTLEESIELLKTDPGVSAESLPTYLSSIKRVFTRLHPCRTIQHCLMKQNIKKTLDILTFTEKKNGLRTQKNTLQILTIFMTRYGLLDKFGNKSKEIEKAILDAFDISKLDSHDITVRDMEKEVPTFVEYLSACESKYGLDSQQYLLSFIYSLFTPRDNFGRMKIIANGLEDDDKNNFIKLDTSDKIVFILNRYKTHKKYHKIEFVIKNVKLNTLLREFIQKKKLGYGHFLFGKAKNLSTYIVKMHKELGFSENDIHKNLFRHIRVTDSYGTNITSAERNRLANEMQHSHITSLNYRRNLTVVEQQE